MKNLTLSLITFLLFILLSACSSEKPDLTINSVAHLQEVSSAINETVVLAINFGGEDYRSTEGISYKADNLKLPAPKRTSKNIKGSQDPTLFETYRSNIQSLEFPLNNGIYHITFLFAEPSDIEIGDRTFDVIAEEKTIIENMDVRLARDGRHLSALTRSANNVNVQDYGLSIKFKAIVGEPILHGIVVRERRPLSRQWKLTWQDEFNYEGKPDPTKWSFDVWPAGKVNAEDQAYTDRLKNVRVENGNLILEAHKEDYQGAKYTSGRIHSANKGDFLYGRADIRARVAAGQGSWSAIWMLPSDPYKYSTSCKDDEDWQGSRTCDAWPNSGEIDIMEHVGYDMNVIHGTVHTKAYYWLNWEQRKGSVESANAEQEFYVYSVIWDPDSVTVLFDGVPYFYYYNEGTGWRAWPFEHPYHLILNLAIGGAWGRAGGPIDNSMFPIRMEVDYVRVYQ